MSLSRILAVNEDPEVGDLRRVGGEGDGLGLERSSPWRLPLDEPVSPINLSWAAAMRRRVVVSCGLFPARLQTHPGGCRSVRLRESYWDDRGSAGKTATPRKNWCARSFWALLHAKRVRVIIRPRLTQSGPSYIHQSFRRRTVSHPALLAEGYVRTEVDRHNERMFSAEQTYGSRTAA